LKKIYISKYHSFAFSSQVRLQMIAELLKNAPVFLKPTLAILVGVTHTLRFELLPEQVFK